jgi:fumarylacetoacetase
MSQGCFIGPGNDLGVPIPMSKAKDHMFGMVLVNDWSARDIQRWEAVPLGPFNAKNWATSISPWVVPTFALAPFEIPGINRHPAPLHYFANDSSANPIVYDVALQASLCVGDSGPIEVTRTSMASLYWSFPEMIVHHTAGGCNLRPGDLLATGTLSVQGDKGQGCLLELSWGGTQEVVLRKNLSQNSAKKISRTFLEDGDEVILSGFCEGEGYRVGFGECRGRLLPARPTVGNA